jgi:O-antigen/teichoic acid export membrane protein
MKEKAILYAKNSVIILIGRAAEFIFNTASLILVSRYLGPEIFGLYAFIRGIGLIIMPIIGYGGYMVLIREFSVNKEKAPLVLFSSFVLLTLLGLLVLLVAKAIFIIFRQIQPEIITGTYLIILGQLFMGYHRNVSLVFIANEKVVYDTGITIFIKILNLLFIGMVIFFDLKMTGILNSIIAAYFIGFLAAYFFLTRNFFIPKAILNIQNILFLLKESWSLIISTLIVHGYTYVPVFMLKSFSTLGQISFYNIPQRFIEPFKMVPRAIVTSIMPAFSLLGSNVETRKELLSVYNTLLKYIMVFFFPVCILTVIYASPIISLCFGKEFLGSVIPLQISIWTTVAFFVITVNEHILATLMRQNVLIFTNGSCLLVILLLGIFLIPKYAAVGASVALLCGFCSLFYVNYYFIGRYLGRIKLFSSSVRPIICVAIMWIFMKSFGGVIHVILLIPSALAIYIIALLSFKTFTANEIVLFRNILLKISYRLGLTRENSI